MSGSALGALRTAIYNTLVADTVTGGLFDPGSPLVTGVFDHIPSGQAFPYITIGDATESPWETHGHYGFIDTPTLTVCSQASFAEAFVILDRMNRLLNGMPLTIAGYAHVATQYDSSETARDEDGITHRVLVRYAVRIQE